jgi:hypothetical protein
MPTITESTTAAQEQLLEGVVQSQKAVLETVRNWTKSIEGYAPATPAVELPVDVPQPAEAVANAFDFAEKLLASQRKFSEELLSTITPKPVAKASKSK